MSATDFIPAIVIDTVRHRDLIPSDVMEDIREVWADCELGNDTSYWSANFDLEEFRGGDDVSYPQLMAWLNVQFRDVDLEGVEILIRFWW